MIKTSKLLKRVWIVAISVIAITLMSVAVSFATEAQDTAVDNTQDQAAIAEEAAAADEVSSAEQDNATPLHIYVKFSDPSIPIICIHSTDKIQSRETFVYDPNEGITFSNTSFTWEDVNCKGVGLSRFAIVASSTQVKAHETFNFTPAISSENIGLYVSDIKEDKANNTVTVSYSSFTDFTINFQLASGFEERGGRKVPIPVQNFNVDYYNPDGTLNQTVTTDAHGLGTITGLDKTSAGGYFYINDKENKQSVFRPVYNYVVKAPEPGNGSESLATTGVADLTDTGCLLLEDSDLSISGNEYHANFILNIAETIGDVNRMDISYVVKEFVAPESIIEGNSNEKPELNLEIDSVGCLSTSLDVAMDGATASLAFVPIAEDGYAWDNWNIMGETYGPDSKVKIDVEDIDDIFTAQANYKLVEASEIAQTSDVTPFAAGVVAVVAAMSGIALIALRKQS